ncbi:uncharacterized protein LOC121390777 [Gigantopelta aegis]|uniref:uncharacterized protein LOC121390777 n=1 Tax=Gigantopelta aegis TaxID=1735272 RepID=UPI001B88A50B|nr:uncharacterized protein LOC121390777 [Gigantopelta aegis]
MSVDNSSMTSIFWFLLQELQGEERESDFRNRQITPRTWNLLHRRRGKLSFSRRCNQHGGDTTVVNNKPPDWSVQRSRAHPDGEGRMIQSGVGCASLLNETRAIKRLSSRQIVGAGLEPTRQVHEREGRTNSTHSTDDAQITSKSVSRSQPSLHSTADCINVLVSSNNLVSVNSRVSTNNRASSISRVNSHHVASSTVSVDVVEARRRRWRDGVFSTRDVESADQRCERATDSSSAACEGKRHSRIHVRPHSVHMVNLSGTSSVTGLSSGVDDCQYQRRSPTDAGRTTNDKMLAPGKLSPSSKYRRAPDPPCKLSAPVLHGRNSSVSANMVSNSNHVSAADLSSPDHEGWAVDQLHGKRVWCILADMLFCTFDSKDATESREVIMLPGCKVRSLVFKSAKRGSLAENSVEADNDRKKTISGVDRYQFLIDNVTSRRKYLFGIETKAHLDKWVELLTQACSVDSILTPSEHSHHLEPPRDQVDNCVAPAASPYLPTNHRCRRMDIMSMSLEDGKLSESQKHDTLVDFKRRLRRESDTEIKPHPLKATHTSNSKKDATIKPKSKSFLKLKSFGSLDSLLRRHKRSKKSDVDDNKLDLEGDSKPLNNTRIRSDSMHVHSESDSHTDSWDMSNSSEVLNPATRRRASDLKDKIFSAKCSPRSIGLRLDDLTDLRICGTLLYKFMERWIKIWCVVSRGCLYGFKSQDSEQSPIVAIVLTRCSVTYVTDPGKRNNQLYVFRLSQPHCKSIYLCAQEEGELSKWLQILQMEASHVLADDSINLDTSDLNYSVDSAFSTMSLSSSHTDLTDAGQSSSSHQKTVSALPVDQADRSSSGTDNSIDFTPEDWDNGSNTSSQMGTPVMEMSLEGAPRHDPNLTRVWQKDKGYLFQVIRAKLRQKKRNSSSDGKPPSAPGPETGGLLVLHDDDDELDNKADDYRSPSIGLRRVGGDVFWSSDGIGESMTSQHKGTAETRVQSANSFGELQTPTMQGYLERRSFNGQWTRYWYVIRDEYLYCYLTPDDKVTVDITQLNGYLVNTLVDEFPGKRFVVHLNQKDYVPVHLSVESRNEMEQWVRALEEAIKLANQKQEINNGNSDGVRQQTVKQKLLAEVLRQKQELEKKQAARMQRVKSADVGCIAHEISNGEEYISTLTRLKQRRLSTQIKMSTIQKQLDNKNGTKKSLFHFGKKKVETSKNPHLTEQLKELSQTLQQIDTNLSDQAANIDSASRTKSGRVTTDINLNRSVDSEDFPVFKERHIGRNNSLKSSVQRLAQKTFAKAGWKKNQKSDSSKLDETDRYSSEHSEEMQDYIDLTSTTPDEHGQLSLDLSSGDVSSVDEGRSIPQSPCSLPDDSVSLCLPHHLVRSNSGPVINGFTDGSSVGSDTDMSSPRREVNPLAMAQIEEFEDFSRQMLEQKSSVG